MSLSDQVFETRCFAQTDNQVPYSHKCHKKMQVISGHCFTVFSSVRCFLQVNSDCFNSSIQQDEQLEAKVPLSSQEQKHQCLNPQDEVQD